MIAPMPSAATMYPTGDHHPSSPPTVEGSPNTPLPMIELRTSAARLQRPMARTRAGTEQLCHRDTERTEKTATIAALEEGLSMTKLLRVSVFIALSAALCVAQ